MMQKIKVFAILFFMVLVQGDLYAVDYKRLILYFDKNAEGPTIDKKQALATGFAINLYQKAAPAIVPYSVLDAFFGLKYDPNPVYDSTLVNPTKEQFDKFIETKKFFKLIKFSLAEWNIYHCKDSKFFLFTPKVMAWVTDKEKVTFDVEGTEVEFSFNVFKDANLEQAPAASEGMQVFREWALQKFTENQDKGIEISQIESIIFNDKDIAQDADLMKKLEKISEEKGSWVKEDDVKIALIRSHTKPWNIFGHGHGSYEETSKSIASVAGLLIPIIQELLLFFNRINTNLAALSSCYAGGKSLDYLQFKKVLAQYKISPALNYILAVISSGDSPSSIYSPRPSATSTIQNFDPASSFNIKDFFLACARKGAENWITDALRFVARSDQHEASENVPQILIPNGGWFQAFTPVKQSFGYRLKRDKLSPVPAPSQWIKPTSEQQAKIDELAEIEKTLKDEPRTEFQKELLEKRKVLLKQLSPSYPPLQQASPIQIIGNVLLKKHEIENKPIEIKEKDVVLMYPEIIPVRLEISPTSGGFPQILSMIKGDAVHAIHSIKLINPTSFEAFIKKSFLTLKGRRAKKTFFIKTLISKEGEYNNVYLQSWMDEHDLIHLKFRYKQQDKYWAYDVVAGQVPEPFPMVEITKNDFNKPFDLGPSPLELEKRIDDYLEEKKEIPEWKLAPPSVQIVPQTDLQKNLLVVRSKLETLHLNLASLSSRLKRLRYMLQPQPETEKSKKLASQIKMLAEQGVKQKACYDLLNTWIQTPPTAGKDLQDDLVKLGKNISFLFTDSKINFAESMAQKLSKDSLRVILEALLIEINKTHIQDKAAINELIGLSIYIWVLLNPFGSYAYSSLEELSALQAEQQKQLSWVNNHNQSVHDWKQRIFNYYGAYTQLKHKGQLAAAKNLHFLAAQLCIFFAVVPVVKFYVEKEYEERCNWISTVLPILQLNDQHKIKVLLSILGQEASLKTNYSKFKPLVIDKLKHDQSTKELTKRVDQSTLSAVEQQLLINFMS